MTSLCETVSILEEEDINWETKEDSFSSDEADSVQLMCPNQEDGDISFMNLS
jgi:hypothetical protein